MTLNLNEIENRTITDKIIEFSLNSPSCILTFAWCFELVTLIIFSAGINLFNLSKVDCNKLFSAYKFNNCLGYNSLDNGHNLLPDPPAKMTPNISAPSPYLIP